VDSVSGTISRIYDGLDPGWHRRLPPRARSTTPTTPEAAGPAWPCRGRPKSPIAVIGHPVSFPVK